MYDLFNQVPDNLPKATLKDTGTQIAEINGLAYVANFISVTEERELIKSINAENWLTDIKRRVQHYGYKYDYKARSIDYSMFLGQLPTWALNYGRKFLGDGFIDREPDQLIINEYIPGQGIANHVDCEPCFGGTVISLSLGSPCVMDFINLKTKEKKSVLLEPRSLVVIRGEARHGWTHGIAPRKADEYMGRTIYRQLRISMTFRKVILIK